MIAGCGMAGGGRRFPDIALDSFNYGIADRILVFSVGQSFALPAVTDKRGFN